MAWYDRFLGIDREEKLNDSQYIISRNEGMTVDSRERTTNYKNAYEQLEIVNRAVNMIVDDVAEIPFTVGDPVPGMTGVARNIRKNFRSNALENDDLVMFFLTAVTFYTMAIAMAPII